ncbi:hypothetical protein [Jiangella gansuensis]|uniref:hypothetical protein n=1 Tax=Jiangella gansuensis TaxID=281473 RepID=UPI000478CF1B|nr:hypothetical protein [Jiangella gansuensis]
MGALDENGIWLYTEDDPASPFSDTLNLLAESTSDQFTADRARLSAVEGRGNASAWSPSFTNAAVGNGAVNAYWARVGALVHWSWKWVFGSTSNITGVFVSDLPTAVTGGSWMAVGSGFVGRGTATSNRTTLVCRMSSSSGFNLWMDGDSVNEDSPLGPWLAGDVISVGGVYLAA